MKQLVKKILFKLGEIYAEILPLKLEGQLLMFFHRYAMGGAEKVHLEVIRALLDYSPTVVFCYPSKDDLFLKDYQSTGVALLDKSGCMMKPWCRNIMLGYFSKILNKQEKKIILFGSVCGFFYELVPYINRETVSIIDLIHVIDQSNKNSIYQNIGRYESRILINRQTYNEVQEKYISFGIENKFKKQIKLIYNAVPIPAILTPKDSNALNVIFVGRADDVKRVHIVGKVASLCMKKKLSVKYRLIGDVESKVYDEDKDCVAFVSKKNDLSDEYEKADVILLTSSSEGFPMVIMEAMAYGVIPIVTDVGGLSDHIVNGETGFLVENFDDESKIVDSFVVLMEKLIDDQKKRQVLSENVYVYAKNNFSKMTFDLKYKELFNDVLS